MTGSNLICCDRAELNVTKSSSDSICKPRTSLPTCPAAIHVQSGKRFPCLTQHNKSQWVIASSMKSHPLCMTKKWKPRLCKFRVFWAQDRITHVFWRILYQGHQSPKLPGGWASWIVLFRKHLVEMDWGNRTCLDLPLPMLFHPVPSIQQGGQLLWPMSKGIPASGGSLSPLNHWSEDPCPAHSGEALSAHRCLDFYLKSPSLPSIWHRAIDITQKDCVEDFQTLPSSCWIETKMGKRMINYFKRSTNCALPKWEYTWRFS